MNAGPEAALALLCVVLALAGGCSSKEPEQAVDAAAAIEPAAGGNVPPAAPVELPPPVEAFPPVPWTVPAGGLPDAPPVADLIDTGGDLAVYLFPGCRDRCLAAEMYFDEQAPGPDKFRQRLRLVQFDPASGKPVGEPITLGPEYTGDFSQHAFQGRLADIAPNGTLAIQALAPGESVKVGLVAPGDTAPRTLEGFPLLHQWFGWTADNRLLVLDEGQLRMWDPATGAATQSMGEKLGLPIVLSPARNWVIATVDNRYLEVFDASTGEVRGRFAPEGQWEHLAVSPDGRRLAAARYAGPPRQPSSSPPQDRYDIHTWDLATGQPTERIVPTWLSFGPPISWAGANHLYHDSRVFDLESKMAIVMLNLPVIPVQDPRRSPLPVVPVAAPDGRTWWTGNCGQAFTATIPLEPAGGKQVFDRNSPVQLEVTGPDAARNRQVEEGLTGALTAAGHTIGNSPWKVRVTSKVEETGDQLYDSQQTMTVPGVRVEMQIVAPDATNVGAIPITGDFSREHSAYLVRKESNNPLEPLTTIYEYDFRGRPPRDAILDECWDKALKSLRSIKHLPTVWEVDGKFQAIPINVTLPLPAGVPRAQ